MFFNTLVLTNSEHEFLILRCTVNSWSLTLIFNLSKKHKRRIMMSKIRATSGVDVAF